MLRHRQSWAEARAAIEKRAEMRPCRYCLRPFRFDVHLRTTYCDRTCQGLDRSIGRFCEIPWETCRCGELFVARRRRHCPKPRVRMPLDKQRAYYRRRHGLLERAFTCMECGDSFTDVRLTRRYCSTACGRRAERRRARYSPSGRARQKASKRRAEYKARGAVVQYPYSREAIFLRDEWLCWICHQPVPPFAVVPDHHASTIDHVVALARGGSDTADNVKLAHFICNSRRGVGAA